jgi:hypothetical protein
MNTPAGWNENYVLINDIDFTGVNLTPVGTFAQPFTGIFDGGGYCLRNAVIEKPGEINIGVFGYIGPGGQVRNLGIVDCTVAGKTNVGGLAGQNDGSLKNFFTTGRVNAELYPGGLVGSQYQGSVSSCYSTCTVTGNRAGGVFGIAEEATITDCYSTGTINEPDSSGIKVIGGFAGDLMFVTISNCYSIGAVNITDGNSYGFTGYIKGSASSHCYWNMETSGRPVSGGAEGRN